MIKMSVLQRNVDEYFKGNPYKLYKNAQKFILYPEDVMRNEKYQKASFDEKLKFMKDIYFIYKPSYRYEIVFSFINNEITTEENAKKIHKFLCELRNLGYSTKEIKQCPFSLNLEETERIKYYFKKAKEK